MIIFIIIFLKKLDQVFSKHIKSNKCSIEQNSPKKKTNSKLVSNCTAESVAHTHTWNTMDRAYMRSLYKASLDLMHITQS